METFKSLTEKRKGNKLTFNMLVKCTVMYSKLPPLRSQTTSYIAFNEDALGTIRVPVPHSNQSVVIMFI